MDELMRLARRHQLIRFAALPTSPEGTDDGGTGGGTGSGGGNPPRTFTQAEVDAMMTREKNQGKAAGIREVSERFGVSIDEAAQIIQRAKDADEAQKTEAQRARDAADAEKRAAEQEKANAAAERHATRVERALLRHGLAVPEQGGDTFIAKAVGLVDAEAGADDDAIKAAVDKLKGTVPALFGTAGGGGQHSDPGAGPSGRQVRTGDFGKDGDAEFERRFGHLKDKASA